jgi:FkbM family methyltransferase
MSLTKRLRKAWYRACTRHVPDVTHPAEAIRSAGFTSQYGQDWFVVERLGGKRAGVFVEVGAFDGVTFSNTWTLEQKLDWTGIAVEPSPTAFALLERNRSCVVVNGCIAATPGTALFLEIEGPAAMLSGVVSHYDPRHMARIERELTADGGIRREIEVPCFPLDGLAAAHGVTHIDYLSIDTEGGELAILQSIDFSRLDVNLISVENNYGDSRLRSLLDRAGFRLVARLACDEIYQHRRHLP